MDPRNLTPTNLAGAAWKKSTHSGNNGGTCVEVATNLPGLIAIRDSKNPTGPTLTFTPTEWHTFLHSIKQDELDLS